MVQIADLVANFRATGLADISRGAQQARQDVAEVGSAARASGEQLDALAKKFQQSQGGAAEQWRSILDSQRLTATRVDEMLGRSGQGATALAERTRAAAESGRSFSEAMGLSGDQLVRAGAAMAGIGLGLSAAVGLATQLHRLVVGIADAQVTWQRTLVETRGVFGANAQNAVGLAQALATTPGIAGGQQVQLAGILGSAYLGSRFGLSDDMRAQLLATAGRVSAVQGRMSDEDVAARQRAFIEAVESGGSALRDINVELDPELVARGLGLSSAAGLAAFTPEQLRAARASLAIQGGNRYVGQAVQEGRAALTAQSAGARQLQLARDALQNMLEQVGQGGQLPAEAFAGGGEGALFGIGLQYLTAGDEQKQRLEEQRQAVQRLQEEQERLNKTADEWRVKLGNIGNAQAQAVGTLRELTAATAVTTSRLLNFTGSPEDPRSLVYGDLASQALGAVGARARGPNPLFAMSSSEIAAGATVGAYQQAYDQYVAGRAQSALREANPARRYLEAQAAVDQRLLPEAGAVSPAGDAQRALGEAERRRPILERIGELQRSGAMADLTASQQQLSLEDIQLRQRERGLQLMRDTVELRRTDVELQRSTIEAGQAVTRAQMAALGPQRAVEDVQYQVTRAGVLARARIAGLMLGRDVSGLPSFDDLISMNTRGQLEEAYLGPAALEAGRAVQVAQRPATAAGLAQQLTGSQLQIDQLAVDLKNLAELPGQTALELDLLQTNRDQLGVQQRLLDATLELVGMVRNGGGGSVTANQVGQMISEGLAATSNAMGPASSGLAGARR